MERHTERLHSPARCPYAPAGLSSALIATCPGFEAERVDFAGVAVPGDYAGHPPRPQGVSCAHLTAARSRRGMRAACGHPDGFPLRWPAAGELVGRRVAPPTREGRRRQWLPITLRPAGR